MTALFGFVFFGLFSPGPNVILLTSSGARFGFRATSPHLFGVALGVGVIAFVTGLGLGTLIEAFPILRMVLMVIASLWILWMAWKLWHAKPAQARDTDRPFTFVQAVLFQWVNPKIWAVATSASAMLTDLAPLDQAVILGLTFSGANLGVCLFWTYAGSLLKSLLADPKKWQVFMRMMAVALAFFSGLVFL
ncbi:LysE family translocator [Octadecabacter ascidiaceicola]|uniref:Cysteine/O-acetylserine efflux protein n=1 Tax=Octadecabacter ascidiaceicola TaxID=1655543 RepID=A0A238KEQ9_9RHOB|nr:LysE family translocator [Octadecabacter ascidiaceicola]SMX41270.1 Cysteine/O-acetylserine efflux protein [Octadecabacter ascidiaceicola]